MSLLERKFSQIANPYLVACEDIGHAELVHALLKHRNLTNCDVGCPSREGDQATGITAIPTYLKRVRAVIDAGKANLTGIMVVADADESVAKSFAQISAALLDSSFPAPSGAFKIEGPTFRTAAFMMPGEGRTGTLEHLLWDAAIAKNPKLKDCVHQLGQCTGGYMDSAQENKKAKMRISAVIASHCQGNPFASCGMIWHEKDNPIPINSPCFDALANFLAGFVS